MFCKVCVLFSDYKSNRCSLENSNYYQLFTFVYHFPLFWLKLNATDKTKTHNFAVTRNNLQYQLNLHLSSANVFLPNRLGSAMSSVCAK